MITYGSTVSKPLIRGHLLTRANFFYITCMYMYSYKDLGLSLLTQTSRNVPTSLAVNDSSIYFRGTGDIRCYVRP